MFYTGICGSNVASFSLVVCCCCCFLLFFYELLLITADSLTVMFDSQMFD